MANYMAVSRTNYFRVTDEEKYEELVSKLWCEDEVEDLSYREKDGTLYHGFGGCGSIDYYPDSEDGVCDGDSDFDGFIAELQKILPEDEAFMLFESGYEKLRYVTGWTIVVTREHIEGMNIQRWAVNKAREILGEDFETRTDY